MDVGGDLTKINKKYFMNGVDDEHVSAKIFTITGEFLIVNFLDEST